MIQVLVEKTPEKLSWYLDFEIQLKLDIVLNYLFHGYKRNLSLQNNNIQTMFFSYTCATLKFELYI